MVYVCSTSPSRIILVMILLGSTTVSPSPPHFLTLYLHVYEAAALLAPTTTMTYVFFGLYQWLNKHPTEAVLVSITMKAGLVLHTTQRFKRWCMISSTVILRTSIGNKYWEQVLGPDKRECTFSPSFLLRLCGAYRETIARNTWTSTSKINPPPAMYIRSLTCIQDQTDPYPT